jgi:hypothetical protein
MRLQKIEKLDDEENNFEDVEKADNSAISKNSITKVISKEEAKQAEYDKMGKLFGIT